MFPRALHIAPHEHPDRPEDKDSAVQALLLFDSLCIHSCTIPSNSFRILSNLDQTSKAICGEGEITKSRLCLKFKNSIYTVYEGKQHKVENQRSSQRVQVTHFKASTHIQATHLSLPTDYFAVHL